MFDWLYAQLERVDARVLELATGAPAVWVLLAAIVLGLRHATDPDHVVAVTALAGTTQRGAAALGAWWGLGHGAALIGAGLPLIALTSVPSDAVNNALERAIGVVIIGLAFRALVRGLSRRGPTDVTPRTAVGAVGVGLLHGLAGTGALIVLLVAALPDRAHAALALTLFACASACSMTACTALYAQAAKRAATRARASLLSTGLAVVGLIFGATYLVGA